MKPARLRSLSSAGGIALLLTGCLTIPPRPVEEDGTYCHRVGKVSRQKLTCTVDLVPPASVEAGAKLFVAVPDAATLYILRSGRADGPNRVPVSIDGGRPTVTIPVSLMRVRLPPGEHELALDWEGKRVLRTINSRAGAVNFIEIDASVWAWAASYGWSEVDAKDVRGKAVKAKLIADLDLRSTPAPRK